jgi:hypothetical protein
MSEAVPPTRRRWYQFGIGTMLLLGHALLVEPSQFQSLPPRVATIPWWRCLFGVEVAPWIAAPEIWSNDERAEVMRIFPETELRDVTAQFNDWPRLLRPAPQL